MKASELPVGTIIAVTDGTSKYEQRTTKATKCQVVSPAKSGYVSVKLLEDARTGLGNRRVWGQKGLAKAGETVRIKTGSAWMPWESLKTRAENERAAAAKKDREEKESEDRLAELQRRTDQFAGEVDNALRWGGFAHSGRAAQQAYVRIPTGALEALLDKAER